LKVGSQTGFTLIEMVLVSAVLGIIMAISLPAISDVRDGMKLGQSMRTVERELQTARLEAVSANRAIRVRFNCPAAGQFRMVELIGTPSAPVTADNATAAVRCSESTYPYPAADTNPLTAPNHDGPVRRLEFGVTFSASSTLEFWPDGTVRKSDGTAKLPWPVVSTAGTSIVVSQTRSSVTTTRSISVNGLGKIQIQR
jgi:prepilin-type N-terminal cleavage/methylation domain-containing protein